MASIKGTKQNPQHVVVRQESKKNNTLSVTLSKSVLDTFGHAPEEFQKIKKGDVLIQWADPTTRTIYLRKAPLLK